MFKNQCFEIVFSCFLADGKSNLLFLAQNTKKNLSIKVLAQYVYTYGKGYKQVKRDKLRTTLKGPCTRFEMEHMSYN